MNYIDAHVHVWTPDLAHYPLAKGFKKKDMKPASFTPKELFKHTKPNGVNRINLIQMSYYHTDNSYMLDMIKLYKDVFVGTAIIDPKLSDPGKVMTDLADKGARAFRIRPTHTKLDPSKWLEPESYTKMFKTGADNNQAMSCLIETDALPELDRMCKKFPKTPVIIDHMCRIGIDGKIRDKDVKALVDMAKHKRVMVKIGAFYAFGKKKAPYLDLVPLIKKLVKAYGADRCMWESDCPFQVVGGHKYADSINLIKNADFLSKDEKECLLRKTAEEFFFK